MAAKKAAATATTTSSTTQTPKTSTQKGKQAAAGGSDAFELLKAQHKDIRVRAQKLSKQLLKELAKSGTADAQGSQDKTGNGSGNGQTQQAQKNGHGHASASASNGRDASLMPDLKTLCQSWVRHSRLEEEIVFPALEEAGLNTALLEQAEVQRDLALLLLDDMIARSDDDTMLYGEAAVFCEMVPRLARFEESRLFAAAKRTRLDAAALGKEIQRYVGGREGTEQAHQAEDLEHIPRPRHLRGVETSSKEYMTMPMRGQERDRDERGRFTEEDDHRGRGRGGSSSRSSSSGRGGRHEDDGDHRGWHGDPRGHSEASHRGWEERRGSSGSGRGGRYEQDEDDDRRSSRGGGGGSRSFSMSRSGGGGRRQGGWFGDSEGHSEASRRGWENSDHGESGWFGDREGHAQASRRGWQNPEHGESGWFGDREGHAQASRRGWENPNNGESGWFGDREGHSEASRRGWRTRRDEDDDYDDRRRSPRRGRD